MTKQGHNYLDESIQEMTSFFETRMAPAPPSVMKPPKKNRETLGNRKLQPVGSLKKPLTTAMHIVKGMIADAQAQTCITYNNLIVVGKN